MENQNQAQQSTLNSELGTQSSDNTGHELQQNNHDDILEIIQNHLYIKDLDFVEENMKQVLPKDLLLPYKYDNTKTILEVILENKTVDFSEEQMNFLFKDKTAAIIFLKNEWFANNLVELLEANDDNDYIGMLLDTLLEIKDSTIFIDLISKNFDRIKSNSLIRRNIVDERVGLIFLKHGVFSPFNIYYNMCLETYNGLTVLEYLFLRYQKGEKADVGIDFFDREMINEVNNQNYDVIDTYIPLCCKYQHFEPFSKIDSSILLMDYKDEKSVLQYILSINPDFLFEQKTPSFIYRLVIEYMKIGNWKAITPYLKDCHYFIDMELKMLDLQWSNLNDESCIDLFIEHDVISGEEAYEVISEWVATAPEEFLLRKDKNGITLLERLLKIDIIIGSKLSLKSINYERKVQVQTGAILAKYGYCSIIDCDDQYAQDFEQYINQLVRGFFETKYFGIIITDEELKKEKTGILREFYHYFYENSDGNKQLYFLVINMFYKYLTINKEMAIQYLTYFVERKKQDPNFRLQQNIRSHYDSVTSIVSVRNYNPYIFGHEVGHSIHHFKRNFEYPEHIRIMIENLRNNPETISRLQSFAMRIQNAVKKRSYEISKQIRNRVYDISYITKIEDDYRNICGNQEALLAHFLSRSGGFDQELISKLLAGIQITFSEYKEMTILNDEIEYEKSVIEMEFAAWFMIENLMDAIFEGKWNSGTLDGVTARCYQGHTTKYYENNSVFVEVYANISGLMFDIMDNVDGIEEQLRYLLGDQLLDALIEYYQQLNQSQRKSK